MLRRVVVKRQGTPQPEARRQSAEHHVGVCDRRPISAQTVGRGTGHRARALGPHHECAALVDARYRSASRPNRVDIHHS